MSMAARDVISDIDKSMVNLREAMKEIPVRRAKFQANHDEVARYIADFAVDFIDASYVLQH